MTQPTPPAIPPLPPGLGPEADDDDLTWGIHQATRRMQAAVGDSDPSMDEALRRVRLFAA